MAPIQQQITLPTEIYKQEGAVTGKILFRSSQPFSSGQRSHLAVESPEFSAFFARALPGDLLGPVTSFPRQSCRGKNRKSSGDRGRAPLNGEAALKKPVNLFFWRQSRTRPQIGTGSRLTPVKSVTGESVSASYRLTPVFQGTKPVGHGRPVKVLFQGPQVSGKRRRRQKESAAKGVSGKRNQR